MGQVIRRWMRVRQRAACQRRQNVGPKATHSLRIGKLASSGILETL